MDRGGSQAAFLAQLTEAAVETLTGAEGPDADHGAGPAGHEADLLHGAVLDLEHAEDEAIFGFEGFEKELDQFLAAEAAGGFGVIGFPGEPFEDVGLFFGEVGHAPFGPGFLGADGIEAMIDGDAGDPVFDGCLALELVEVLENPGEDVLGEIFFGGAAGEVGADDPDDEGVEEFDEFAGGFLIVLTDAGDAFGGDAVRCGDGLGPANGHRSWRCFRQIGEQVEVDGGVIHRGRERRVGGDIFLPCRPRHSMERMISTIPVRPKKGVAGLGGEPGGARVHCRERWRKWSGRAVWRMFCGLSARRGGR